MKTVGVKELKKHLSEVLHEVETQGQIIGVSNRGRVVARLVPSARELANTRDPRATIADIDALAAQISADTTSQLSVEDALNEIRR